MAMSFEEYRIHLNIGDFTLTIPAGKETSRILCQGNFKQAYEEIKKLSDKLREMEGKDKEK